MSNEEKLSNVQISWLITIYPRTEENLGKTRDCGI